MMDLSNPNRIPFGRMSEIAQWALKGAYESGENVQFWSASEHAWFAVAGRPIWGQSAYRLHPKPVEATETHKMQISAHGQSISPSVSTCGQTGGDWVNGTLTLKTIDGRAVSATWEADQ
mgnify:CR=1 FL=1